MSEIIKPDFGRTPFLNRGDFVRMVDCDCCHGIVVSIESRYMLGEIAGQASEFSVAVPNEEGTWSIEDGHTIDSVVRVLVADPELAEQKDGKVLQFEDAKVRVNCPGL